MSMSHPETDPDTETVETFSKTPPPPRVPWERRKHIGYFRAYWRTAKMVMLRPHEFEKFMDEPVNVEHAKYFRSLTFQLIIALTFLMAAVFIMWSISPSIGSGAIVAQTALSPYVRMMAWALSMVGLFLATRSLEWFSRPRMFSPSDRQKAVALSCYICAPVLIVTIVGTVVSATIIASSDRQDSYPAAYAIAMSWLAIFLAWYPAAVRALHFTTGRNIKRTVKIAIGLPLVWAGQQLLMIGIPLSFAVWYNMAWSFL